MTKNFRDILEKLPEKKVDSRKFNEVFHVDGIPLWYFLEPLMKTPYMPKPFRSLVEIERDVKEDKTLPASESLKLSLLRKALAANEKIKFWITRAKQKKTERIGKVNVMFLTYTNQIFETKKGSEFLGFGDVVNDLKKRGVKLLVLVCDPLSKNSLFELKKFDNPLYAHIDSETIRESERVSRELVKEWKKVDKKTLFTFQGENYWKFFKNEMNFLFSREILATLIKYYLTFKKIFKRHNLELIYLTGIIGIYESAIFGAACKLNKKIVYSPHGYGSYAAPLFIREEFYKNFLFATSGVEEKRKLLKLGIKPESIFMTGNPFFDKIAAYMGKRIGGIKKKTITLLTQPLIEDKYTDEKEYFHYIRKFLIQINNVKNVAKIVVKLHPRERYKSRYESIVKSLGLKNVRVTHEPGKEALYSILSDSDLLISFGSTTDIEGLMLGKNVVVIDGLKKGLTPELLKKDRYRKVTTTIDKDDDLTSTITKVLNPKILKKLNQKREKYLMKSFFKIDGRAYQRVADLIYKYSKSKKIICR